MTTDLDFLRELCAAPAPTGFEAPAQEVVRRRLLGISAPQGDPLGNVWADIAPGGTPHVVVTAHNDQIGLIVTYVDDKGFVSFDKIGGVDAQLLPGRNLIVHAAGGPVNGVVGRKPSHKMSKEERAKAPEIIDQWLDIGASSRDEALALVQIGDPITFPAAFLPLAGGRLPRRPSTTGPASTSASAPWNTTRRRRQRHGSPAWPRSTKRPRSWVPRRWPHAGSRTW